MKLLPMPSDIERTLLDALDEKIYLELIEALNELDSAFKVTAESANARRWVEACWSSKNDPNRV